MAIGDRERAAGEDISRSLLVDLYELTMVNAYRRTGMADRPATFSLFVRALPPNRGYLVAAGLDDALRWLEGLRFGGRARTKRLNVAGRSAMPVRR